MFIELLWIIPIIAAALFLPIIILSNQKNNKDRSAFTRSDALEREVELFNLGELGSNGVPAENRLHDIVTTITRVSQALSSQQKLIKQFAGKDAGHDTELVDLKEKLTELQREYDIVISENYSLRARLKKIMAERASGQPALLQEQSSNEEILGPGDIDKGKKRASMALYDDTRMFRREELKDDPETELSGLG